MIGKVVEIFIPNELVDVMNSSKIGFRVKVENEIIAIIMEQDEDNAKIFREDIVRVIMNNNNEIISLKLFNGEDYD